MLHAKQAARGVCGIVLQWYHYQRPLIAGIPNFSCLLYCTCIHFFLSADKSVKSMPLHRTPWHIFKYNHYFHTSIWARIAELLFGNQIYRYSGYAALSSGSKFSIILWKAPQRSRKPGKYNGNYFPGGHVRGEYIMHLLHFRSLSQIRQYAILTHNSV